MLFTRHEIVVRTAAALARAVSFGAREAIADSDASQISRNAAAALRRLDATDHRAITLGAKKLPGFSCTRRSLKAAFIFGGQGGKGVLTADTAIPGAITRLQRRRSACRPVWNG